MFLQFLSRVFIQAPLSGLLGLLLGLELGIVSSVLMFVLTTLVKVLCFQIWGSGEGQSGISPWELGIGATLTLSLLLGLSFPVGGLVGGLFGRMFNSQVAARRIAKVFAFPFGFASFGLVCELVSHGGDGTGLQAFETGSQAYGIVHALAFLVSVPARYVWCGWAAETASAAWTEDAPPSFRDPGSPARSWTGVWWSVGVGVVLLAAGALGIAYLASVTPSSPPDTPPHTSPLGRV